MLIELPPSSALLLSLYSPFFSRLKGGKILREGRRRQEATRKKLEMSFRTWKAAKAYRDLLKAVKKHIGSEDYKNHFREYVTQEFRKNSNLSDQSNVQQKIKLASDYTFLLNSVHHHKDLLMSYNIAVDRSDEMKRVMKQSAASVGLRLPEVYQS